MTKEQARLKEIEERKAALRTELAGEVEEARVAEIKTEAESLSAEEKQLRAKIEANTALVPGEPVAIGTGNTQEEARTAAVKQFRSSGHMTIRNNIVRKSMQRRTLLVSSGKIATPTAVATEIGELPSGVCSIVDDVFIQDATGTGAWKFPYRATDAAAAAVVEGSEIAGTPGTFDYVTINPEEFGVLDEVSNQISKMTDANYAMSVQNTAYLALRRETKKKITAAIIASSIAENLYSIALDQDFLRTVILGFGSDESVGGGTKLYINKADLGTLGKVRGTSDKKPVFEIEYTDENNGMIKDGGLAVPFSLNSSLTTGQQIYGQPQTVKLLLWGDYEVKTDEGGEYFKKNTMGVRGLQTANAGLTAYHGMQVIHQAAQA